MFRRVPIAAAISLATLTTPALAQTQAIQVELPTVLGPPDGASPAKLNGQQLDQLLAPIALYPDNLLTDILAASTYATQIVAAQRFAAEPDNQGKRVAALADAAAARHWDASVQALLPFPHILSQLGTNLDWTYRLGQAFIAQQADVLDTVQRLRQRAEAAGTLTNGPQDDVVNEGGDISIQPPSAQQVYVPNYDAACVYAAAAGCQAANDQIGWGDAFFLPFGYWQWGYLDWAHRHIALDRAGSRGGFDGGSYRGVGGLGAGEAVWRHAGVPRLAFSHGPAEAGGFNAPHGGEDGYHYAPPAGQRSGQGDFGPRPILPRPIETASFGAGRQSHGPVGRPAAVEHGAAVAHGGGFGGPARR